MIFMFEDMWRRRDETATAMWELWRRRDETATHLWELLRRRDETATHRGGGRVGVENPRKKLQFTAAALEEVVTLPAWHGASVLCRTRVLEARIKTSAERPVKYTWDFRFRSDGSLKSETIEFEVSDAVSGRLGFSNGIPDVVFGTGRKWKFDLDYEGSDSEAHLKLGHGRFGGVKYLRSVTKALSLGADAFWLAGQGSVGFEARYTDKRSVATAQLASVGLVFLTYTKKIDEELMLANEFMWNWHTRKAHMSVGWDIVGERDSGRWRIDSAGTASGFYERHDVLDFCSSWVSTDINLATRNWKFGAGITVQAM